MLKYITVIKLLFLLFTEPEIFTKWIPKDKLYGSSYNIIKTENT